MPQGTVSDVKREIQLKLANVTVADAVFINHVIALFCDPHQNISAECLRSGLAYINYGQGGKLVLVHRLDDLHIPRWMKRTSGSPS